MKNISIELINNEVKEFYNRNRRRILCVINSPLLFTEKIKINNTIIYDVGIAVDYGLNYLYIKSEKEIPHGIIVEIYNEKYKIYGLKFKENITDKYEKFIY